MIIITKLRSRTEYIDSNSRHEYVTKCTYYTFKSVFNRHSSISMLNWRIALIFCYCLTYKQWSHKIIAVLRQLKFIESFARSFMVQYYLNQNFIMIIENNQHDFFLLFYISSSKIKLVKGYLCCVWASAKINYATEM